MNERRGKPSSSARESISIVRASLLNPIAPGRIEFLKDGALAIRGGTIAGVGEYRRIVRAHPRAKTVDLSDRLLIPGFVDTHVHLPQYPVAGLHGKELLDWLNSFIYPAERNFTPAVAARLAPVFFARLLSCGVTTAAVYCSVQKESTRVAFRAAERSGIRAMIGKAMMDRNVPAFLRETTERSLRDSEELCREWNDADRGRLMYAFTPRYAASCSAELMREAARMARASGAHLQTHLAENRAEVEWVRKLFPKAGSYTQVYENAGMLTQKTVLAHCIYLGARERALIARNSCGVAHCPTSNLFLQSGMMPLREMLDSGLRIGLGSDVAGGPTLDPFATMRAAVYVATARALAPGSRARARMIDVGTAFFLATLGGATALGLERVTGNFAPGKDVDFVVINPAMFDSGREAYPVGDRPDMILSRLVFLGSERAVEQTYVRGRRCYPALGQRGYRRG